MARSYDLVIVGTGTAAMGVAMRVRAAGWRVAVIDFRPYAATRRKCWSPVLKPLIAAPA